MKTYKSKFGYEVVVFLTVIFGIIIGLMIYQSEPLKAIISVCGIFALVYVYFLYLNFSTKYTITKDGLLKVKCGFFYHKSFDINKITSIKKSTNLISSPAPSLDRIELTYGKFDLIVISPKDKFEFANELTNKNQNIENKLTE
ncbi:PH domain-containing protein [Formosa haliotis]|uniref:PH domain-containing protein n=1 Tax=Formosa haliotis TaxID=1555194 RepID=UPI000826E1EB|nr:PH domain-containing protein [Formosa haliotis]